MCFQAVLLHKALSQFAELPGAEQLASEVTSQLSEQVQQAQTQQLSGNKAGKVFLRSKIKFNFSNCDFIFSGDVSPWRCQLALCG
jgi:hypothetical protein